MKTNRINFGVSSFFEISYQVQSEDREFFERELLDFVYKIMMPKSYAKWVNEKLNITTMEKQAAYGKDPVIEINESIDLGNNQAFNFSLRIKESRQTDAMTEINKVVQTLKEQL